MRARLGRWGNSLALRIPKPVAADLGLGEDSPVELEVVEGTLVVVPTDHDEFSLDELLEGVTADNLHAEVDTGAPVGREGW